MLIDDPGGDGDDAHDGDSDDSWIDAQSAADDEDDDDRHEDNL